MNATPKKQLPPGIIPFRAEKVSRRLRAWAFSRTVPADNVLGYREEREPYLMGTGDDAAITRKLQQLNRDARAGLI